MIRNLNILIQNFFVDWSITKWWKRGNNKLFHKGSTMCWTVGAGECTTHFYPRERRTSLTFICIKSECPTQARIGGGSAGVSNDWCITGLLWWIAWYQREQAWHRDESTRQYGPRSISLSTIICRLSWLVPYSVLRGFRPGTLVFPSHQTPAFDLIWWFSLICSPLN